MNDILKQIYFYNENLNMLKQILFDKSQNIVHKKLKNLNLIKFNCEIIDKLKTVETNCEFKMTLIWVKRQNIYEIIFSTNLTN